MELSTADRVWNRAALESGGGAPGPGDRALASLLHVHGLIMNGGVHHAIDVVGTEELLAAADGYSFFGFNDVAVFLRRASDDPLLSVWNDNTEAAANRRYAEMVPDETGLATRFQEVYRDHVEQFAPLD